MIMKQLTSVALFSCIFIAATGGSAAAQQVEGSPLISSVAKLGGIPEIAAKEQIERVFSAVRTELLQGRAVAIPTFGRFSTTARKSGKKSFVAPGVNSTNGAADVSSSNKTVRFAAAENLRIELNRKPR